MKRVSVLFILVFVQAVFVFAYPKEVNDDPDGDAMTLLVRLKDAVCEEDSYLSCFNSTTTEMCQEALTARIENCLSHAKAIISFYSEISLGEALPYTTSAQMRPLEICLQKQLSESLGLNLGDVQDCLDEPLD